MPGGVDLEVDPSIAIAVRRPAQAIRRPLQQENFAIFAFFKFCLKNLADLFGAFE